MRRLLALVLLLASTRSAAAARLTGLSLERLHHLGEMADADLYLYEGHVDIDWTIPQPLGGVGLVRAGEPPPPPPPPPRAPGPPAGLGCYPEIWLFAGGHAGRVEPGGTTWRLLVPVPHGEAPPPVRAYWCRDGAVLEVPAQEGAHGRVITSR